MPPEPDRSPDMRSPSRMSRAGWLAAGALFFALGWIGLVLPMLPGVLFLIAAAFCFARGSPAWERRMLDHPRFGQALRDWRERRAISRRAKRSALFAMALAGALAGWLVGFPLALISIGALCAAAAYVWTRAE